MRRIALFCFSGTGSTQALAKALKDALDLRGFNVDVYKVEDVVYGEEKPPYSHFQMIGFLAPIYGFGAPRIIHDLIRLLPRNRIPAFIILTGCTNGWLNKSASQEIINHLNRKWYDVFYDRIVITASNWLIDSDDDLSRRFYQVMRNQKVPHIAYEIDKGKVRRFRRNFFREILLGQIHFWEDQVGARYFGRSLYTNKDCTQCGLCVRQCPSRNLELTDKGVRGSWKCLWCMKCVYSCPVNALHSRGMDIVQFKSGFNYRRIVSKPPRKKVRVDRQRWRYMEDRHR